ncbi:MAG: PfkB family carbohydrate kinase, partial [Acidimicrobiia bacterium]|nr:PfkB family carbohydrate kinase [Acidimicrobiia bacterium]
GGPSGLRMTDLLLDELDETEIGVVPISGDIRESLSVRSRTSGEQYRFVLPGPQIGPAELDACLDAVIAAATPERCRCVVVSGSLPPGVDPDFISDLVARAPHVLFVVDTSGPALAAALRSGAYLIKPSARELAAMAGRGLDTEADIIEAAIEVKSRSSVSVLVVSIGPGGAVVLTDGTVHRLRAPAVKVRSAVGAGDSMVAGIATGLNRNLELLDAVRLGVAAGTAAVLTEGTDLCAQADVDRLLPLVG